MKKFCNIFVGIVLILLFGYEFGGKVIVSAGSKCSEDLELVFKNEYPNSYMMIDSTGHWPKDLGSYDDCRILSSAHFASARYDLIIGSGRESVITGLCVPMSCNESDLLAIAPALFEYIFQPFPIKIDNSSLRFYFPNSGTFNILYDYKAIIMLSIILVLVVIVVISTTVHEIFKIRHKKVHLDISLNSDEQTPLIAKQYQAKTLFQKGIESFSCIKNYGLLCAWTAGQYDVLNGIRVCSMIWIILGHSFTLYDWRNMYYVINVVKTSYMAIMITGGQMAVDTFFFLSGFLFAISMLKICSKQKPNYKIWIYAILHRYMRIVPLLAFMIFFFNYVTDYIADGPLWFHITTSNFHESCSRYWWSTLLFINNIYPKWGKSCFDVTWYLANDFQFFLVSLPLLYLLWRYWKRGIWAVGLLLFGCIATTFTISYIFKFSPYAFQHENKNGHDYTNDIYQKPYTRIAPYLIGLLLGWYIFTHKKKNSKISATKRFIFYISSAILLIFSLFGNFKSYPANRDIWNQTEDSLFLAFFRPFWGLGIAFLIFVWSHGYGSIVNRILSGKIWLPLSRLTFGAYLLHPFVINLTVSHRRVPFNYSHLAILQNLVWSCFFAYSGSLISFLLVEKPFANLWRLCL